MRSMYKLVLLCLVVFLASVSAPVLATELVNMEFQQAPLVDVFQVLGQLGGYNVLVDPSVSGQVSFSLKSLPVEEALDLVTRTTGYRYQIVGNTMVVASEQRLQSEFGTQDFSFMFVQHVEVDQAQRLLSLVVPSVRSYTDAELGLIVVFGFTKDLEIAKSVVSQYDRQAVNAPTAAVPVTASAPAAKLADYTTPVFYGDGASIAEFLRQMFPAREFEWNAQTQNVRGTTTEQEWTQVKVLAQEKDIPKFQVKGILGSADDVFVLIEHRGSTSLLKQGDVLHDWTISSISDGEVEFALDSRTFIVRMGR